jgi:hypothetical protein
MTPKEQEFLSAAFYNQIEDALELIERVRPMLKKLARQNQSKSPTALKNADDIPELLSESIGISGLLHLAMGTYSALEMLELHTPPK